MDRSNRAVNSEPNVKDYCPSCSIRLLYSSRLNDHFCTQCGYVRKEGKPIALVVDGPNPPDNNSKRRGPLTPGSSSSTASSADDVIDSNIFIRPITQNRSQESLERDRRRNLQGYDNDMKRLETMGYNIVNSEEHILSDNSTFNSDEVRGSFSNLQNNRRMYFR